LGRTKEEKKEISKEKEICGKERIERVIATRPTNPALRRAVIVEDSGVNQVPKTQEWPEV